MRIRQLSCCRTGRFAANADKSPPEFDILDVWFDSGSSHLATLGSRPDLPWPSELYIEGGDQYRGWFQSSLLIAVALRGEAPYRTAITHGWTLDEQGRAMSKSKKIGIDASDLVKARGRNCRLLFSSVNYVEDIRILTNYRPAGEAYRKIRNTCRFMLGNLSNQQDSRSQISTLLQTAPYGKCSRSTAGLYARAIDPEMPEGV
jgi:isoleucyl-tRNA synthetase